jgi:hypothetical protein
MIQDGRSKRFDRLFFYSCGEGQAEKGRLIKDLVEVSRQKNRIAKNWTNRSVLRN